MDGEALDALVAYRRALGREIEHHRLALDDKTRALAEIEALLARKCEHAWTSDLVETGVEKYMAPVRYCSRCETTSAELQSRGN